MQKKLLLSVSLLCTLVSAQAHAFLDDYSVFVINDERDDPVLLNGNADIIDTGLLPDLMCCGGEHSGLVKPLYAQNPLVLSGMIGKMKAYIDQGTQDASRDSTKKSWLTFWKSLSCSDTSQTCTGVIQTTLNQFDEAAYVTQPDLQAMVQSIIGDYNEGLINENGVHYGMKKLIISHGRGSFYANQAWNYINLHNPNIAQCIGIVAIGTPATYVSNSGQYTTNDIDKVVNLTRSMAWWGNNILPANYSLGSSWLLRDITAHDLFETYLSNSSIKTQLRAQISVVANQINSACPPPTPPPPPPPPSYCQTDTKQGGDGTTSAVFTKIGPNQRTVYLFTSRTIGSDSNVTYDACHHILITKNGSTYTVDHFCNSDGQHSYVLNGDGDPNAVVGDDITWATTWWGASIWCN